MRVTQIDHVELEVPDRYAAARWYQTVLGFEICREYEPRTAQRSHPAHTLERNQTKGVRKPYRPVHRGLASEAALHRCHPSNRYFLFGSPTT
jgi:catechol-2,3-dioxygenase